MPNQRLELTWIGKGEEPAIEPRILLHDADRDYGDPNTENMLIHGDNLLALKALEQEFAGRVKCIYIDPPFNTQQAFEHYQDGLEHSIWLNLMYARLKILHTLLAEDGTLYVHIDDNEFCYLIAVLDEIMGRSNRISIVTFKQASATGHKAINRGVVSVTNFILIYAKEKGNWHPNKVYTARKERDKRYGQFIENYDTPYANWRFITLSKAFASTMNIEERSIKKALGNAYEDKLSEFVQQNASKVIQLANPDYNAVSSSAREIITSSKENPNTVMRLSRENYSDMYFHNGKRILFYSDKLKLIDGEYVSGEPLTSLWDDILSNNIHNEGGVDFPKGKKPEALIKRCLEISTNPGDLVLDSFLGSGTTAAVAHKMGRRYIGIELGGHCYTHCKPRLDKVVDGEQGGISKSVNWQGGGGYKFYELAPTLIVKDKYGNPVFSDRYNSEMLVAAVSKINGYRYAPDRETFWKQGSCQDSSYIFVTTEYFTAALLDGIAQELGELERLLVCAPAFDVGLNHRYENIIVKKIPDSVLKKCEYGVDNYNLNIVNPPELDEEEWEDA